MSRISLFLLLSVFCQLLIARPVTQAKVQEVLPRLILSKGLPVGEPGSIEPFQFTQKTVFYVVNLQPEGWMLVAADDAVAPVLAYSPTGRFYTNNQPEALQSWLTGYAKQLVEIDPSEQLPANRLWTDVVYKSASSVAEESVEPLIKVKFNQSSPWNKYCPSDASGKAVVGCVAVAMAQAMTVPQYPDRPTGFYSYSCPPYGNLAIDYSAEPALNWNLIIAGTDGKDAAARLLYQCGVAVEMGYSASGSGTQTSKINSALRRHYSYPNSVKTYTRSSYTDDWENLIKNEILHGRAVVYAGNDGTSNPGHAFNLDGYDGNGMYHINWGWGGANNGYYGINNVKDGQNDYTKGQQVIVGIRAPSVAPSDILISNLAIAPQKPAGTIVGAITIDSEATDPQYSFELKGPYSIFLHDYMPSSFYVEDGYLKSTRPFDLEDDQVPVSIKVTNTKNGLSYEKDFIIRVVEGATGLEQPEEPVYSIEGRTLQVEWNSEVVSYSIYSLAGSKMAGGWLVSGMNSIRLDRFEPGYYVLVPAQKGTKPAKIVIQ